jgi:hypothetical protein
MISLVAEQAVGSTTIEYQGSEIDLSPPWERMPLAEALRQMAEIDIEAHPTAEGLREEMIRGGSQPEPGSTRGKLIDSLLGTHVEPRLIQPTILYDYPRDISPLAKSKPGDPGTVERLEGLIGGMEICNAFTELNDAFDQESRFMEMGRDYQEDDEERHGPSRCSQRSDAVSGIDQPSVTWKISSAMRPWASRWTATAEALSGASIRQKARPLSRSYQYFRYLVLYFSCTSRSRRCASSMPSAVMPSTP